MSDGWQRLHPLSPIVRGGRGTIGLVVLLVFGGARSSKGALVPLAIAAVGVALGVVSWLVTRWRIDGDDLQIETGLLRRQSLRYPLSQVQAIDVVRPGLARVFQLAELRLRMGGATGGSARLAYLRESEVEPLRARLLALAHGTTGEAPAAAVDVEPEAILTSVPTARLVASILISDVGLFAEAVVVALVVTAVLSPGAATAALSSGTVWILAIATQLWRRFNQEYRLTVTSAPDGLHLHGGLVALTAETIRPGRVQGVRMVEPMLWRRFGWCRVEVDVAGRQRSKGEGRAQRRQLRALLPVGNRALAEELLDHVLPDRPRELAPPPGRVIWKSPLRYRMLAAGRTDTCVATRTGRIRRVTSWVPLEKAQSVRRVQGPVQRRLRLASVFVDTAGRSVRAALRDRDAVEAEDALWEITDLARTAREVNGGPGRFRSASPPSSAEGSPA